MPRKTLLLIAPKFFGYHKAIISEFESQGFDVTYLPDRPSESTLFKSMSRVCRPLTNFLSNHHCEAICAKAIDQHFDLILVIGAMSCTLKRRHLAQLKQSQKKDGLLIAYFWDSLRNCPNIKKQLNVFDCCLSFDADDCRSKSMTLLPLFFTRNCEKIRARPNQTFSFDACFIGSSHQISKFRKVSEISRKLKECGSRVSTYYYMPSKSVAFLRKLLHPEYRDVVLRFTPLSQKEANALIADSKIVIDAPQSNQTGLTIRCIEALGAQKKILTTNSSVEFYDFFPYGNVQIYPCSNAELLKFLASPPNPIPKAIVERYSIKSWVRTIIECSGKKSGSLNRDSTEKLIPQQNLKDCTRRDLRSLSRLSTHRELAEQ